MDISDSLAANSAQQNYDEYLAGPKTVTVEKVTQGSAEQPVDVHLVEFPGKPFKPAKSVRRVLAAAWGTDASQWAGRRMTIYGDPEVRYAGKSVGGLRVSHLSHITEPITVALTVTRGKRAPFTVHPLPDAPTPYAPSQDWLALIKEAETHDEKIKVGQSAKADGAPNDYMDLLAKELS